VERPEPAHALLHHPLHLGLHRHVAHHREGLPARLADQLDGLGGRHTVEVADHDARALRGEEHRSLAPHAHGGAGDQRDLVLQPFRHLETPREFVRPVGLADAERAVRQPAIT
jgi:hypothetical protein